MCVKTSIRRTLIGVTVLLFLTIIGTATYRSVNAEQAKADVLACELVPGTDGQLMIPLGRKAPDFSLQSSGDKPIQLEAYLHQNRLVLVEFFATWCPHCQHSVEAIKNLEKDFSTTFQVISINAGDKPEEPSTTAAFQKAFEIHSPIAERPSESLKDRYCLQGFPTFYLLDPDGAVLWRLVGTLEGDELNSLKAMITQHAERVARKP